MLIPRLSVRLFALALVCLWSVSSANAQRLVAITDVCIETAGKAGTIESGTVLIRDGKIAEVGTDVKVPISAQLIDGNGLTVMPGIVDPYFVVPIARNTSAAAVRTVVFQGRTFTIGGGSPAIATTFAKVADGLDISKVNWNIARRSGITTLHVVTGGYAQSMLAQMAAQDVSLLKNEGKLLVAVTNDTTSLNVLRGGLKPSKPSGSSARPNSGRPSGSSSSSASSPTASLWKEVTQGKSPVFVNANNASAMLHVANIYNDSTSQDSDSKESSQAKLAIIASGSNTFLVQDSILPKSNTLILSPSIDLIPNTAYRINVPKLLTDKKIEFAFSLSLGQSDFSILQDTPLFGVAMLVRGGLDRQQAIRALTLVPAKLLGLDSEVGSIEVGKKANLVLFDGDPFDTTTSINQVLVEGVEVYEN